MLDKKMLSALNTHINRELHSGYIYLAMAAYFESQNFSGFAKWMRVQAMEEQEHAMKFFDYVYTRGSNVTLEAIDQPPLEWNSPLAAFEQALAHEKKVTAWIYELVELAAELKDYATVSFLQWFINEQVEEEDNAQNNVDRLTAVGDHICGQMFLDKELGNRARD
jgi:ferritin